MEPEIKTSILEPTSISESTATSLLRKAKRWITIIIGMSVLGIGIALVVLPGPAILVIPVGLAILATELVWAQRLLHRIKEKMPFQKNKKDQEPK